MRHLVILSRGHGYGHAAKDLQVIEAIRAKQPGLMVSVASSGTGLDFYTSRSVPCVDLGIADSDDQGEHAAWCILRFLLRTGKPDLVVANEVFTAPAICRMLQIENLLLTHWFFSEIGLPQADRCLLGANAVILLDFAAAHRAPVELNVPIHSIGALAKSFPLTRRQARRKLGLAEHAFAAVVTIGAPRPDKIPDIRILLRTVLNAWRGYARPADRLFLLVPPDADWNVSHDFSDKSVCWIGPTAQPETYFRAADVVLAYATFTTLSELARNRVPTVAIIGSINRVDRLHAEYIASTGHVAATELAVTPEQLWHLVQVVIEHSRSDRHRNLDLDWADSTRVADLILSYL